VSTRDDDAAWQQIVENYGERPDVPDPPAAEVPVAEASEVPLVEAPEVFHIELYDEQFVPPPLPPPPVIKPERRVAWVGLIGSPVLLVVLSLIDYSLPAVLTGGLVIAFLASFGYLVATMEPHDPDDDGARV
jgi:hypothetical protein